MKEFYQLLGLTEDATDEEIEASYQQRKAKYREDSFKEGEEGNEAARMLHKLNVAYTEIMTARREKGQNTQGNSAFADVEELIRRGDITGAQSKLDAFDERNAEWHYLQSVVFYKKAWMNESKKQLEIAMQMDGSNEKYKNAYRKLNDKMNYEQRSGGVNNTYNQPEQQPNPEDVPQEQMGGNWCSECLSCCYTYMCVNCLFNICCGCH